MKNLKLFKKSEKYISIKYIFQSLHKGQVLEVVEEKMTPEILSAFLYLHNLGIAELRYSSVYDVYALIPRDYKRLYSLLEKFNANEVLMDSSDPRIMDSVIIELEKEK